MGSFNASLKTIGDTRGIPATVELQEGRLSIKAGDSEIGDWSLEDVDLEPTPTGYKLAAEGDQVLLDMSDSERFAEELSSLAKNGSKKKEGFFSRRKRGREESELETPPFPPTPVETPPKPELETLPKPSAPVETPPKPKEAISRIPTSVTGNPPLVETAERHKPEPAPVRQAEPPTVPDRIAESDEIDGPSLASRLVEMLDRTIDATERRWGPLLPNWVFNRIVFVAGFVLIVLAFVFRGTTSLVLLVTGVLALMVGGAAYTDDVMASKLLPGRATPTHVMVAGVGLLAVGIGFGLIA